MLSAAQIVLRSYAMVWFATLVTIGVSYSLENQEAAFEETMISEIRKIPVTLPNTHPEQSIESIHTAIAMFSIVFPKGSEIELKFDPNLLDRGLTKRKMFSNKIEVSIGRPAFLNWSILGSTLAHEIEVHSNQSVAAIFLLDSIGMGGTQLAERQAYLHEMMNAERFGLADIDQSVILDTMDFYYPLASNQRFNNVRNFFARSLLSFSNQEISELEIAKKKVELQTDIQSNKIQKKSTDREF